MHPARLALLAALGLGTLAYLAARGRDAAALPTEVAPALDATRETSDATRPAPSLVENAQRTEVVRSTAPTAPEGQILITGRVLDLPGDPALEPSPAPGLSVTRQYGWGTGLATESPAPAAATDERGHFALTFPDPGRRPLRFSLHVGFDATQRATHVELTLAEEQSSRAGVELLRPSLGSIAGLVSDALGAPLADVIVVLTKEAGRPSARSAADGRFQFDRPSLTSELSAERPGYLLLAANAPSPLPEGGWEQAHLVLSPRAALRVVLRDGAGEPLAQRSVGLAVSRSEPYGPPRVGPPGAKIHSRHPGLETDADGVARFDPVWAQQRLEVYVEGRPLVAGRPVAGGLVLERDGPLPIVVAPGAELELQVVREGHFEISGRVEREDGSPVPEARLRLRPLLDLDPWKRRSIFASADAEGRFRIVVDDLEPLGALQLVARDGAFGGMGYRQEVQSPAQASLLLEGAQGDVDDALLVLHESFAIAGQVHAPGVERLNASVRLRPAKSSDAGDVEFGRVDREGHFRISGLEPGRYDVHVTATERAGVKLRDVEAGREDLEFVLDDPRPVVVHVDVVSEVELKQVIVLSGSLAPHDPEDPPAAPRLRSGPIEAPFGWPETLLGLWYGSSGGSEARGTHQFHLVPVNPATSLPYTLRLDEGLGWIGVKAVTPERVYTFPLGTGLVDLRAGELPDPDPAPRLGADRSRARRGLRLRATRRGRHPGGPSLGPRRRLGRPRAALSSAPRRLRQLPLRPRSRRLLRALDRQSPGPGHIEPRAARRLRSPGRRAGTPRRRPLTPRDSAHAHGRRPSAGLLGNFVLYFGWTRGGTGRASRASAPYGIEKDQGVPCERDRPVVS